MDAYSAVASDALLPIHQSITIRSANRTFLVFDLIYTEISKLQEITQIYNLYIEVLRLMNKIIGDWNNT